MPHLDPLTPHTRICIPHARDLPRSANLDPCKAPPALFQKMLSTSSQFRAAARLGECVRVYADAGAAHCASGKHVSLQGAVQGAVGGWSGDGLAREAKCRRVGCMAVAVSRFRLPPSRSPSLHRRQPRVARSLGGIHAATTVEEVGGTRRDARRPPPRRKRRSDVAGRAGATWRSRCAAPVTSVLGPLSRSHRCSPPPPLPTTPP